MASQGTHHPTGSVIYALAILPEGDGNTRGTTRLVVPGSLTLDDLHTCLRVVLGREDDPPRSYFFALGERRFLRFDPAEHPDDERLADAEFACLDDAGLVEGDVLRYVYDLVEFMAYRVRVESIRNTHDPDLRPRCVAGTAPGPPAAGSTTGGRAQCDTAAAADAERRAVNRTLATLFASLGPDRH